MERGLTDIHIHAPPFTDGAYGGDGASVVTPTPASGLLLGYLSRRLGIERGDPAPSETYMARLDAEIESAKYVSKGVVFGLDGVYDGRGVLDEGATRFRITNDRVLALLEGRGNLLFGASINPERADAVDELDRCSESGARLVKVLPNTQSFDPADKRHVPFYRKMAERGLPLLSHSGFEFALPAPDQSLGDPARLRRALDEGVTVISAHGASTGLVFFERYLGTARELAATYDSYFLDTSAMTLPIRAAALFKILKMEELRERLLFGTDYPIPMFLSPFVFSLGVGTIKRLYGEKNYFDRQYLLFTALGAAFGDPPLPGGS